MRVIQGGAVTLNFNFEHPSPCDALIQSSSDQQHEWQMLMEKKKPKLPELRPHLESMHELIERYLPLHSLKFCSRIEGIKRGLHNVAKEQKKVVEV